MIRTGKGPRGLLYRLLVRHCVVLRERSFGSRDAVYIVTDPNSRPEFAGPPAGLSDLAANLMTLRDNAENKAVRVLAETSAAAQRLAEVSLVLRVDANRRSVIDVATKRVPELRDQKPAAGRSSIAVLLWVRNHLVGTART